MEAGRAALNEWFMAAEVDAHVTVDVVVVGFSSFRPVSKLEEQLFQSIKFEGMNKITVNDFECA